MLHFQIFCIACKFMMRLHLLTQFYQLNPDSSCFYEQCSTTSSLKNEVTILNIRKTKENKNRTEDK